MRINDLPTATKRRILDLLVREKLSVDDIATRLGVTPAAVRQHLVTLDALGLVDRRKGETRADALLEKLAGAKVMHDPIGDGQVLLRTGDLFAPSR